MSNTHRVVIVGGGFAGMACAAGLGRAPVEVTLIDRRNFHLFQPLLYQVATGGLSPANIAAPLRSVLKRQRNVRTIQGEVSGFDMTAKEVQLSDGSRMPFDTLVVASGSTHHYFGKDAEWSHFAPGLKTVEDATAIRGKILTAFEKAERETNIENRARLLTFVIVGGGPTGVEMAGSIAELAHSTMKKDFRTIDPASARIILVENSERVLQMFPDRLSDKGMHYLQQLGVELMLNNRVVGITADSVVVDHAGVKQTIPTETVIWAAGVKASPLAKMLAGSIGGIEVDKGGRIPVNTDCTVGPRDDVYALGDMMSLKGKDGKPLPGVAPVAIQQGQYVAEAIKRKVKNETAQGPFQYWDKGTMATVGRSRAIAMSAGFQFTGGLAWLMWLFIHIMYLARFENRVLVLMQWGWNYISRNRTARLITNSEHSGAVVEPHPTITSSKP
jgi:NADH dehydrogenase